MMFCVCDHETGGRFVESEDFDGENDLKDFYFPDDPTGELVMANHIRFVFKNAGYKVRYAAKDEIHPVWIIRLICDTASPIKDRMLLFQHVYHLLKNADIKLRKTDLAVLRTGNRILVSFLWQPDGPELKPVHGFNELLAIGL